MKIHSREVTRGLEPPGADTGNGQAAEGHSWPFNQLALCLLLLIAWLATPMGARAQQEPTISFESSADYNFGQLMRFSLAAVSELPVSKVTLYLRAPELPNTLTADVTIPQSREVDALHIVDLTQLRLAPFTTVSYWWLIEDEDGNLLETDVQTIEYVDDQYEWHETEQDGVQVYWTGEESVVGLVAMDSVLDALPQISSIIPADQPHPLRVYVYPTAADLRAGLRLAGREWVGAHARPELGVILVAAGNSLTASTDLAESIPHELAHLYLYEAARVGYESAPVWFDEGLATLFESEPNPNYESRLEEATAAGETLAFVDLCYAFPADEDRVLLAYAQSVSFVRYIQSEYGNQALRQMILELADGANCETMSERALGISLTALNQQWLEQVEPQSLLDIAWRNGRAWLAIIAAGFLLLGFLVALPKGLKR